MFFTVGVVYDFDVVVVGVYGIHKGVYDLSFALIGGDIYVFKMVQYILELLLWRGLFTNC